MSRTARAPGGQTRGQGVVGSRRAQRAGSSPTPVRPPSPVSRPLSPRPGISLTEVLIAMGILTIGLLGVASIFPVASFYMQKGDVADSSSAVAQAAFNDVLSRGMLDPQAWLMLRGMTPASAGIYDRNFQSELRNQLAVNVGSNWPMQQQNKLLNARFGYAYIIDPFGADSSPVDPNDSTNRRQYRAVQTLPLNTAQTWPHPAWSPWNPAGVPAGIGSASDPKWPLMRVPLPQAGPSAPWPMTTAVADRLFRSSDDLSLDVPTQADRPSRQLLDQTTLAGSTVPLARQSRGDYSWIVTIVPPSADARNALAIDPSAYKYEVSVAVFHKRIIDNFTLGTDSQVNERLKGANVVSTGLSGGELLLTTRTADSTDNFDSLKVGNWVVVCGPHPASTDALPRFVMRWYRLLSVEGKDRRLNDTGTYTPVPAATDPERRLVALRGPQWPWQPAPQPGGLTDYYHLSNNICVAIIPNVVAVHSKTIQLESKSSWSVR